jgi:hypothetical protein
VAIRRAGDKLVIANLEGEKFPVVEYSPDPEQVGRGLPAAAAGSTSIVKGLEMLQAAAAAGRGGMKQRCAAQGARVQKHMAPLLAGQTRLAAAPPCALLGCGHRQPRLGELLPRRLQGAAARLFAATVLPRGSCLHCLCRGKAGCLRRAAATAAAAPHFPGQLLAAPQPVRCVTLSARPF